MRKRFAALALSGLAAQGVAAPQEPVTLDDAWPGSMLRFMEVCKERPGEGLVDGCFDLLAIAHQAGDALAQLANSMPDPALKQRLTSFEAERGCNAGPTFGEFARVVLKRMEAGPPYDAHTLVLPRILHAISTGPICAGTTQ